MYHSSFYFPYHQTDVKHSGYGRCTIPLSISHTTKLMSNIVDMVDVPFLFLFPIHFPYHQTDVKQSGYCRCTIPFFSTRSRGNMCIYFLYLQVSTWNIFSYLVNDFHNLKHFTSYCLFLIEIEPQ